MKLNGKRAAAGAAAAGLAIVGVTGGGVALASARTPAAPAAATVAATQPFAGWCPGYHDGMPGWQAGQQPVLTAAASYLGMSQATLRTQLQAGHSLADVARAQHKTVAGLKAAILAAITSRIDASHTLTAAQRAQLLSEIRSHLDDLVNAVHPIGDGLGRMGSANGMGMWR